MYQIRTMGMGQQFPYFTSDPQANAGRADPNYRCIDLVLMSTQPIVISEYFSRAVAIGETPTIRTNIPEKFKSILDIVYRSQHAHFFTSHSACAQHHDTPLRHPS